jgi:predicted SnoaL-like aldol condensation-catalyzing enzyme
MKNTLRSSVGAGLAIALAVAALPAAQAAGTQAAQPPSAATRDVSRANKALVVKAYQELFGDHDLTALDRYWAKDYIQHNPTMGDGTEQVKQFLEKLGLQHAHKFKVEFLRVAAEGDLVFIHTRQPKMGNNPEMVIVDIFRVAKGRIVEHWDVMQPVPADAANKRPMY